MLSSEAGRREPVHAFEDSHFLFVRDGQAYLDPGTAGFFFQMVVGSILGALLALKVYWRKVKATAKSLFSSADEKEREQQD
jgi:hypothetical protein